MTVVVDRTLGLTSGEAATRLVRDGANVLPAARRRPLWMQFVAELGHFFALMLWVAGVLAWLAGMPELAVAIAAVVLINATFSFVQERRSDRAAERLSSLLPRSVVVRRDGEPRTVDAATVVVGDVLLLSPGDRICADADAFRVRGLRVDTSMLTGESEAIGVEQSGRVDAGTFVVDGEAEALVVATGGATRIAEISTLTTTTKRPQRPLTTELNRVVRAISIIAVSVGLSFMLVAIIIGIPGRDAVVFAIGVTVALVPEGLLPTVTLALAIGAQRMARRNALVRHLDAVETLGSTTFICTDKTGTLTQNRMVVSVVWTPDIELRIDGEGYGPDAVVSVIRGVEQHSAAAVVRAAARCGVGRAVLRAGAWDAFGDPMEVALDACARRLGIDIDEDRRLRPEVDRFPFDASRRRMSAVFEGLDGAPGTGRAPGQVIVKGAVEAVLPLSADPGSVAAYHAQADLMAASGLRVLAVAERCIPTGAATPAGSSEAERDLHLLGLVGLLDPPRPAAAAALAQCRRAGIKVGMITGDHPRTALAIGDQIGLTIAGSPVVVAGDLPLADEDLGELLDHDGFIVSRATPEDKLRIAVALRERGHVIAVTGDGVNDGPVLRAANIGIAMGRSGTDVAREAADIVLLDDDFATIVAAVAQGRATFLNVRRFLTYHLTDNVAELTPFLVWALSGGRFPLALTVMQILALDVGTDTTSATALGAEPPAAHVLDRPPVSGRLLNRSVAVRAFALLGPTEALVSMAAFLAAFLAAGWRPGDSFPTGTPLMAASGAAFLAVVLGQKANAWACRSASRPPWRLGWWSNRILVFSAAGELLFAVVCLEVGPIARALDNRFPPMLAVVVATLSMPAVWGVDAWWKRRRAHPEGPLVHGGSTARGAP